MKIAVTGGGSGGHVYPIRSLIQYCVDIFEKIPHCEVFWFGSQSSMEERVCLEIASQCPFPCKFISIMTGKWRREKSFCALWKNIIDLFCFLCGVVQVRRFLVFHRVDVIFCKGGYAALPLVFASKLHRIPLVMHESDCSPGLVNLFASRIAKKIFCGFPNVFPGAEVVGQILSPDVLNGDEKFFYEQKKITDGKTVVLVFGGSLGSRSIYDAVWEYMTTHSDDNRFYYIVGGELNIDEKRREGKKNIAYFASCSQAQMGSLYRLADWAVMRAGTTSLAEAHCHGVQCIIIPLLITHDQKKNAEYYRHTRGFDVIYQDNPERKSQLFHLLDKDLPRKKAYRMNYIDPRPRIVSSLIKYAVGDN